jgi:hypothetical protein
MKTHPSGRHPVSLKKPTMNTIDAMNTIQLLRVSPMASFNTTTRQSGSHPSMLQVHGAY